jgi:hypothetical protein
MSLMLLLQGPPEVVALRLFAFAVAIAATVLLVVGLFTIA